MVSQVTAAPKPGAEPDPEAKVVVRNWAEGARDLARGLVTSWLRDELRDRTLTRFVLDLADDTGLSPDLRLLVFAWRVAPTLPAVWKGMALADDSLAQACQRAIGGSAADAQCLAEVYRLDLAVRLPEGHPEAAGLARRARALAEGVRLHPGILPQLEPWAREFGVPLPPAAVLGARPPTGSASF